MKNILLIGLGAVGLTYAVKLKDKCNLKILVNNNRLEKYTAEPPVFNNKEQQFDYICPDGQFKAELIIIAVKSYDLDTVLSDIKSFVTDNTKILSLINGISSESIIQKTYPQAKVIKSYFVGHSAVRFGNKVTQDGVGEIVMESDRELEEFFKDCNINYSAPDNIDYSMWLKFSLNLISNPASALLSMNFGSLKHNNNFKNFSNKIIDEVIKVGQKQGIPGIENLKYETFELLSRMCDDGKTSMYQDILARRKTEIDIFCGEIIQLGRIYNIPTPYNQVLYDLIKIKEEDNEYSVHPCEGRE